MSYFDTLTKHQQAYRALREKQYQLALDCIKAAGLRGMHKKAVHRETKVRESILNPMVDDMHAQRLIHVAGWTCERSCYVARYAIGDKPDVPFELPAITPKALRQRERRHGDLLKGTASMTEEQQLKAAVERKHQAWAKNWTPRRDPAASWI